MAAPTTTGRSTDRRTKSSLGGARPQRARSGMIFDRYGAVPASGASLLRLGGSRSPALALRQHPAGLVGPLRPGEQEAVRPVAAELGEAGALGPGLHGLGDDVQATGVRQADDARDDRVVLDVTADAADVALVELHRVDRQLLERAEGGVPGAE